MGSPGSIFASLLSGAARGFAKEKTRQKLKDEEEKLATKKRVMDFAGVILNRPNIDSRLKQLAGAVVTTGKPGDIKAFGEMVAQGGLTVTEDAGSALPAAAPEGGELPAIQTNQEGKIAQGQPEVFGPNIPGAPTEEARQRQVQTEEFLPLEEGTEARETRELESLLKRTRAQEELKTDIFFERAGTQVQADRKTNEAVVSDFLQDRGIDPESPIGTRALRLGENAARLQDKTRLNAFLTRMENPALSEKELADAVMAADITDKTDSQIIAGIKASHKLADESLEDSDSIIQNALRLRKTLESDQAFDKKRRRQIQDMQFKQAEIELAESQRDTLENGSKEELQKRLGRLQSFKASLISQTQKLATNLIPKDEFAPAIPEAFRSFTEQNISSISRMISNVEEQISETERFLRDDPEGEKELPENGDPRPPVEPKDQQTMSKVILELALMTPEAANARVAGFVEGRALNKTQAQTALSQAALVRSGSDTDNDAGRSNKTIFGRERGPAEGIELPSFKVPPFFRRDLSEGPKE